jgi:AraC family transcriptional regulator
MPGSTKVHAAVKTVPSINAHQDLPGSMTSCSWRAGWRSVLLRSYDDAPEAEFTTRATPDHLIVLVVDGQCEIESRYPTRSQKSTHRRGSINMTPPGEEVQLRWKGETGHSTLQLHIPERTIRAAFDELAERNVRMSNMPERLLHHDPVVGWTILSLSEALAAGAPDLYADTTAHFLTIHLLTLHANAAPRPTPAHEDLRMKRVDDYLRANLGASISLDDMADVAGISRFHLLRLFKDSYEETPFRRLTRMRMEEARRRLVQSRESVTDIGFACGYENPAHFASAFKREFGLSPRQYRQGST